MNQPINQLPCFNTSKLTNIKGTAQHAYEGVSKGAYVISPATKETADAILIATGSEVNLAVEAQKALEGEGIDASVVSMPSWDRFEAQSEEYKESVLPKSVKKRLAIEMGSSFGWHRYAGDEGDVLAIDTVWRICTRRNSNGRIRLYS